MRKQVDTAGDSATKALTVLQLLLRDYHPRNFAIRLWDGTQWPAETDSPSFTLILSHPHALRCLLKNSDLAISESYIRGDLDLEGDLEAAMPLANYLMGRHWPISTALRIGWNVFRMSANGRFARNGQRPATLSAELHSVERDRQPVTYHYNVSKDFYPLWLHPPLVYSCAYFETTHEDLDTAQWRKLDYLCLELR